MRQDITAYELDCIIDLANTFIKGAGYDDYEIIQILIDTLWYKDSNGILFNEVAVRSRDGYVLTLRWDIEEESFYDYIDNEDCDPGEGADYKEEIPEYPEE